MDMTLVVCFYQLHIQVVVIITGLELHKRPSLLSGQISDGLFMWDEKLMTVQ
jgi:hypothetical protein